jgi:hypothetical protein
LQGDKAQAKAAYKDFFKFGKIHIFEGGLCSHLPERRIWTVALTEPGI